MKFFSGLSGRLLILTTIVVMVIEVAIFVPSVARYRLDYLHERISRAHIASLTLLAAPETGIPQELEDELLINAEVVNIVLQRDGVRQLVLMESQIPMIGPTFDLRDVMALRAIYDALKRLVTPPDGHVIRVVGRPPNYGGEVIEITLDPAPMRNEMIDYGWRILRLSLIISLITAAGIFFLIRLLVVRPLMDVIDNVTSFRENPEDATRIMQPKGRSGEIAEAEQAVAEMQQDVHRALKERARLASLGEAVAKISHDLRNILSSQQLLIDRLEQSSDPVVTRAMPKVMASLDRAIRLCQRTLDFGKAEEPAPELRSVALRPLVMDIAEGLGLGSDGHLRFDIEIAPEATILADPEQLHRVITNLMRNASQAIASTNRPGVIVVGLAAEGDMDRILIADSGPGLPKRAIENLFQPFKGGVSKGGTGLGLAIAQELVSAHGGSVSLIRSTTEGTVFAIDLPAERRQSPRQPARQAARTDG